MILDETQAGPEFLILEEIDEHTASPFFEGHDGCDVRWVIVMCSLLSSAD